MATLFSHEDKMTCCHCGTIRPSFRLISLERVRNSDAGLIPECMVTLLCDVCLKYQLEYFHGSLGQCSIPLGNEETDDSFLVRQFGVLVVPISLTYDESRLLVEELETNGLECFVH